MESEFFLPRVRDTIRLCDTSSMPRFIGFLTADEAAIADNAAKNDGARYEFFGGYSSAERVYFGVFPDWCEDREPFWPIEAITFTYRKEDKLTHRDFLGALMSLGITRETVGDILVEEGRAVIFLCRDIHSAALNGIDKVGRVGVKAKKDYDMPLPEASKTKDISDTVASARLDAVVAALINSSRGKAAELIENGYVSVNSLTVEKTVKTLKSGDRVTVRGVGKFIIDSVEDRTRKDRIILRAKKYI